MVTTSAGPHENVDKATVAGFGDEWSRFDQSGLSDKASRQIFAEYFSIFPWSALPVDARGADIGCGSGRWAQHVAPRVGQLFAIDASAEALAVARRNLAPHQNVQFELASVNAMPIEDGSLDFAYSLGVLHHVPDTQAAMTALAQKLKPGAPFLVYLYYNFDNRGPLFRALWQVSNVLRIGVSRLPSPLRFVVSQILAGLIYWPLTRMANVLDKFGILPESWPLSYYRDKPFYVMRTDALDRFGTRLEQRFSRVQIKSMLEQAGFKDIAFSDGFPFWVALGIKQ